MAHLQYLYNSRIANDLGPRDEADQDKWTWRRDSHCVVPSKPASLTTAETNNPAEIQFNPTVGYGKETGDRKHFSAFTLFKSMIGKYCTMDGIEPELSMLRTFAARSSRANVAACIRYRSDSVTLAVAAATVLLGGVTVASRSVVWVEVKAFAFNLTTRAKEKNLGIPRNKRTKETLDKLMSDFPDPKFHGLESKSERRMYLTHVDRDSPRTEHDFAATCLRNSPRRHIGRWLWAILHRASALREVDAFDIETPSDVISSLRGLREAVVIMEDEAQECIVAIVEGMHKSALRPLPESYFGMQPGCPSAYIGTPVLKCLQSPSCI